MKMRKEISVLSASLANAKVLGSPRNSKSGTSFSQSDVHSNRFYLK